MKYFEDFIKRANTHQLHFEDAIMLGRGGIEEYNDKIEKFFQTIRGLDVGMNYTTKIDGAPAIFIWSKFPGYPDNSICLKSFVSNANNCMSLPEEIDERYGDRPEMAEKLKYALFMANAIPENECWQGDCLFGPEDKKIENIRGKEYITFHPNKIVYAFSEENPDYEKVKDAWFGIAFHTIYKPTSDGGKSQTFRVDVSRLKGLDNSYYVLSPALNYDTDKFDYNEIRIKYDDLKEIEVQLLNDPAYEEITSNEVFMSYWNTFENANIADKRKVTLDTETFFDDLWDYIEEKQTKEWAKKNLSLKTAKGRSNAYDKWLDAIEDMHDYLRNNKDTLTKMVRAFNLAALIKMELWNGFKNAKGDYSTFYKSKTRGIIDADMEGIAMSDAEGNIVKIVDRSTFSANNRDDDILAGWEHSKLKESYSSSWGVDDTEAALQMMREFAEKHHTVIKVNRTKNKEAIINIDGSDFGCTIALGDCVNFQENISYNYHIFISGAKLSHRKDWWGFTIKEFEDDLKAFDSVYHFAETGLKLKESNISDTIVLAFGRMNPPTIGHKKLVNKMAELAKEYSVHKARLYLSHSVDKKNEFKNPLNYDDKVKYCKLAFEPEIDVVSSDAKTIIYALHDLYEEGFKKIIYVGGEDRIGGEEDISGIINKYNGYPAKENMYYEFENIVFENAGHRDENSNSIEEQASGSLARKCVIENNFETFKKIMPFDISIAEELFNVLRDIATKEGL